MDEDESRLENLKGLPRQGQMMRIATPEAASTWAKSIQSLPQHVFKFALNATHDVLPHNANLHLVLPLCHQPDQNLIHVLNNCKVALDSDGMMIDTIGFYRQWPTLSKIICLPPPPRLWICPMAIHSQPTLQLQTSDWTLCGGMMIRRPLHWWS